MPGIVWVLGAGFSMPLGAPSLTGLISEAIRIQLQGLLPQGHAAWASTVQRVYESGQPIGDRPVDNSKVPRELGAQLWRDPEEFLDVLDLAKSRVGSVQANLVANSVWQRAPKSVYPAHGSMTSELAARCLSDVHREATRFCAAACCAFLDAAENDTKTTLETERWEPYVRWKRELLSAGDTVITFNWDRVLDLLAGKGGVELVSDVPGKPSIVDSVVPVLHMHGHVSWQRAQGSSAVSEARNPRAAVEHPETAVLGTPGGGKKTLAESLLSPIWQRATERIKAADTIVFLGYRFPPSDNMAKRVILGCLKLSRAKRIHVVLGPRNPDVSRLVGLLNWTHASPTMKREIVVHDMGAEDVLTVGERRHF